MRTDSKQDGQQDGHSDPDAGVSITASGLCARLMPARVMPARVRTVAT